MMPDLVGEPWPFGGEVHMGNVNALTVNKSGMGFKIQITITRKLNVNIDHVSKQDLNRLRQKF